jgi:hypothetical protein
MKMDVVVMGSGRAAWPPLQLPPRRVSSVEDSREQAEAYFYSMLTTSSARVNIMLTIWSGHAKFESIRNAAASFV